MAASLEETLISVWKQVLAEDATIVMLEDRSFPVQRTSRSRLREVDVEFEGHALRGLEQNPETASRWAWLRCPFISHLLHNPVPFRQCLLHHSP